MEFEISAGQVKALQKSGAAFTLLDVRELWEYETARLEGVKHIPMADIPSRAPLELDPEEHVVVMCHHGVRSLTVTNWLHGSRGSRKCSRCVGALTGGRGRWIRRYRCIEAAFSS